MSYEDIIVASHIVASSLLKFFDRGNLIDGDLNMLCEALADDAYTKVTSCAKHVVEQQLPLPVVYLFSVSCYIFSCQKNWIKIVLRWI